MRLLEYISFVSTFKPIQLGNVELDILSEFVHEKHLSTYSIFKNYKKNRWRKPMAYKNVHKRIKRLEHLGLIEIIDDNFDHGAKHYRITEKGLLNYMCKGLSESPEYIIHNKETIIIRSLLLEYFEEDTIDSFYLLKDCNTRELAEYLFECCSITAKICLDIWSKIEKYDLTDIIPDNEVIQKYIVYLDEKPVDDNILNEITEYKKRFSNMLNSQNQEKVDYDLIYDYYLSYKYPNRLSLEQARKDVYKITEEPPFPFNYMYVELSYLESVLYEKIRGFAVYLVTLMGQIAINQNIKNKDDLAECLEEFGRDYSMRNMLKDKKFFHIIKEIKKEFDLGYKQFIHFH